MDVFRRDVEIRISGGERTIPVIFTIEGSQPTTRSVTIPAGENRCGEIKLPVDVKSLAMVAITATADVKITAITDKEAKPIELKAGRLLLWSEGCGYERPLKTQEVIFEAAKVVDAEGVEQDVTIGIHLL